MHAILNARLHKWCEDNGITDDTQAGFRPNYSTGDHTFSLQSMIQKYACKKRGRFYCLFDDFSKAFDNVNH